MARTKKDTQTTWDDALKLVDGNFDVVTLWHPDARGELANIGNGIWINVKVGDCKYQLRDGSIVEY